jgi:hypothetical protein
VPPDALMDPIAMNSGPIMVIASIEAHSKTWKYLCTTLQLFMFELDSHAWSTLHLMPFYSILIDPLMFFFGVDWNKTYMVNKSIQMVKEDGG